MSVKFQEDVTKSIRKDTKELAHKVGERLTGGDTQTGYLAVC
jgi:hypothetical protein